MSLFRFILPVLFWCSGTLLLGSFTMGKPTNANASVDFTDKTIIVKYTVDTSTHVLVTLTGTGNKETDTIENSTENKGNFTLRYKLQQNYPAGEYTVHVLFNGKSFCTKTINLY